MKKKRNKIAYTFVIADLFHYGILQLLEKAASVSDRVICGLLTDNAVEMVRKAKPISKFDERKSVIEAVRHVDEIMPQHSQDPTANLKKIYEKYPESELIFVYGDIWKEVPGKDFLNSIKAKTMRQQFYNNLSNTKIAYRTIRNIIPPQGILDTFTSQFTTENVETFKKEKSNFVVTTKAQTLKILSPLLKKSKIEKMFIFTVNNWEESKRKILNNIKEKFKEVKVVVRSSCINEDSLVNSKAGCYHSELNINTDNKDELSNAVERVIESYRKISEYEGLDQVLVQKQTENILISGVLLTSGLKTNAPYYVINYIKNNDRTDLVTGGETGKLVKIFKHVKREHLDLHWRKLLNAVADQLRDFFFHSCVDF